LGKFKDLTGQRFGRLTVVERAEDYVSPKGHRNVQWLCKCDCEENSYTVVSGCSLTRGLTKSCGCLRKETMVRNRLQAKRPYPQNPCNDDKHENE
jgi:hypothetical protein